jgi:O-antigen/teichoic acid export membrane protein
MNLSTIADQYCPSICRPFLNRVQQSPIGKRIVSGTFWLVVGNGFGKVFTFIAMVLVARILGKEAFGEFGLVRSTASMFVAFSSFGMGLTATKYIAELLHTDKERTGRIIGLTYVFTFFTSLIVAIAFYLISPWLCETQLGKPELTNIIQWGAILLFLMAFMGTQVAVMTGFQDFRGLAIVTGIVGMLSLPIYVGGAYWFGMFGSVVAVMLCIVLNIATNSLFIYKNIKKYKIRYEFSKGYKELSVLWNLNLPITIFSILFLVTDWLVLMMLRLQPDGTTELGIFYAAQNIQIAFFFLPTLLGTVFFPNLCSLGGVNQKGRYWVVVRKGIALQTVIALITVLPMILFSGFLMRLNGNEFADNNLILIIFGILGVMNVLYHVVWQILVDQKKMWNIVIFEVSEIIVKIILSHLFLEIQWGAIGIVTAIIAGRFVCLCLMILLLIFERKT